MCPMLKKKIQQLLSKDEITVHLVDGRTISDPDEDIGIDGMLYGSTARRPQKPMK